MPIIYKIDVLKALKQAGYNTNRLRIERLISGNTIQALREYRMISMTSLAKIRQLLNCQPGDIIAFQTTENSIKAFGAGQSFVT